MEIYFVTAHGRYRINALSKEQTLQEICWFNKIPGQNVTFYGMIDGDTSVIIGKHEPIKKFEDLFQSLMLF